MTSLFDLPPQFVHAVLLGLIANTAAVVIGDALSASHSFSEPKMPLARRASHYAQNCVAMFMGFFVVYLLTGFVPMGYVPGANPLLSGFRP